MKLFAHSIKYGWLSFLFLVFAPIVQSGSLENLPDSVLRSVDFLSSMSNESNKNLPRRIDQHIELTTTLGQPGHYTFIYRTVNLSSDQAREIGLIEAITPNSISFICADIALRRLIDAGVLITAHYVGKNMMLIGDINVSKDSC